jgi:signal transduction histidine kinase
MFPTEPLPLAALVAFTALGANLVGTGLLILIHPGSREVRWHAAFSFWVMAWLAVQGSFALGIGSPALLRVYGWTVHLMPAFFLAAALVETKRISNTLALGVVGLAAATAPVLNPVVSAYGGIAWQALMWGSGALLHFTHRVDQRPRTSVQHGATQRGGVQPEVRHAEARHAEARHAEARHAEARHAEVRHGAVPGAPAQRGGEEALKLVLLVIVPVAVIAVILLGRGFLLYGMPLLTIVIQFLIFTGVVHHRFYDIEVRAARSGELAAQAAEQERLALLGELSATLAHEIRNPLTGMRSLAQRLAGSDVDADRRTRYAGVILGEIERLDRIVGNLLDLSRRTAVREPVPATTPLAPLFDDLVLLVEGRARRAQVTIRHDPAGLSVAAPRDALAQALLNLLINAVAHSPPGGSISLVALPPAGERIEVRVTDSGPGVPQSERERIFDPFHTQGLGAGLGLAVVRRLARELEWDVGVSDAPGGGACFYLRMPVAA